MNVLSLFDGISCGQAALERAGIKVDNYFASELDKYAIQVTQKNYPNTVQLGDVTKVESWELPKIDLLIGGSPCQGFSFAGKQLNFNDSRSALFFEFVRLLKEVKPKYFLLENVKMKKEYQDVISSYLGVDPIEINSSLVSAQNRKRLYWTNIPNIKQPKDKGIFMKDILEDDGYITYKEKAYALTLHSGTIRDFFVKSQSNIVFKKDDKGELKYKDGYIYFYLPKSKEPLKEHKYKCNLPIDVLIVPENTKKGYIEVKDGDCFDYGQPNSKTRRGRCMKDKSNALLTSHSFMRFVNFKIRKLTPLECERLQTLPDNYTDGVSNTQRYKALGNGFTVDVIAHILKQI